MRSPDQSKPSGIEESVSETVGTLAVNIIDKGYQRFMREHAYLSDAELVQLATQKGIKDIPQTEVLSEEQRKKLFFDMFFSALHPSLRVE